MSCRVKKNQTCNNWITHVVSEMKSIDHVEFPHVRNITNNDMDNPSNISANFVVPFNLHHLVRLFLRNILKCKKPTNTDNDWGKVMTKSNMNPFSLDDLHIQCQLYPIFIHTCLQCQVFFSVNLFVLLVPRIEKVQLMF